MRKIAVGVTGASGSVYAVRILEALRHAEGVETHLVMSDSAKLTLSLETDFAQAEVEKLAHVVHANSNVASGLASGSFGLDAFAVVPCSIKTLSGIAHSYADNLITRTADVMLKERRPLVLAVRETPLHKGHLKLMYEAADLGAVIVPPMVACYTKPQTVEEVINHGVGKILDLLKIEHNLYKRWEGR